VNAGVEMFLDGYVTLHKGDCLDVLKSLSENSVDSVVCDPPYHLTAGKKGGTGEASLNLASPAGRSRIGTGGGFMGKEWDGGDIAFRPDVWRECLRALKPGGYLLAFASTRGFGRMSVAIEDAGFVVHPMIAWLFGTGFPKATRVKAEGYDGFRYGGQALKPAIEPIFMGQRPFSEPTGTANILRWGTGAVNIDGCRVNSGGEVKPRGSTRLDTNMHPGWARPWMEDRKAVQSLHDDAIARANEMGRWPANVVHDGSAEVLAGFPDAPGAQREVNGSFAPKTGTAVFGDYGPRPTAVPRGDSGSAARFFYSAKASAADRIGSKHPTVKPVDLMRWLVRLVTPPKGTVLDPFAGTGTSGEAAWREGINAILIEREPEYRADIVERMRLCPAGPAERKRAIAKRKIIQEMLS